MSEQVSTRTCGCPHDLTPQEIIDRLNTAIGDAWPSDWAARHKGVWTPDISAVRRGRRKPVLALCEALGIEAVKVYRKKK